MKSINLLAAICLIFATACNSNKETMPTPPVAKKIPTNLEKHGDKILTKTIDSIKNYINIY